MVDIWIRKFKGHDEGDRSYFLSSDDWAAIGSETAKAIQFISSDFVRFMHNIAEDRSVFTAESYSFWFMYIAPHLLKGRFQDSRYFTHFEDLVEIMKRTLLLKTTNGDIEFIEQKCGVWVAQYEEYVFSPVERRL